MTKTEKEILIHRENSKRNYYKHRDKILLKRKEKYNKESEQIKELSKKSYYKHKQRKIKNQIGWNKENKDRLKLASQKYVKNHKEKINKYAKEYYCKNKEIMQVRELTRHYFKNLKKECQNCGSNQDLQSHHPKPYRFDVFEILCNICHLNKHGKEVVLDVKE